MGLGELKEQLGKILIDKEELRNDIKDLRRAADDLKAACDIYKRTSDIDKSRMDGRAASGAAEHLGELHKSMKAQADRCESLAKYMETVIAEFDKAENDIQAQIRLLFKG